jgi:cell division ATPase FtsA
MVAIKDKEVQQYDIERVIETARAVNIPMEQQVLHILEQEFIIDGQGGVRQPLGMSGMRLEVKVHIVTGAVSAAQNIMKCVRRCGLEVKDLMLQPLASADAVLLDDERDLGVCLVDIGGGTTDIAVFTDGAIRHTSVIPIAGDQITNDIAMALRTPTKDAEELKIAHGVALRQLASSTEMIEVPGVGDRGPRELSRQTLAEVIEPRVEELYSLIQRELRSSGLEELLSSGIVITGGSALMKGMVRPFMWINQHFGGAATNGEAGASAQQAANEVRILAELVALHIWFRQRVGNVTCVANPAIQLDDQVRIYERQTGETYIHYVRGINTTHDLDAGTYTMTLTTHWMGTAENWAVTRENITSLLTQLL